jgi:hypothetical protein
VKLRIGETRDEERGKRTRVRKLTHEGMTRQHAHYYLFCLAIIMKLGNPQDSIGYVLVGGKQIR